MKATQCKKDQDPGSCSNRQINFIIDNRSELPIPECIAVRNIQSQSEISSRTSVVNLVNNKHGGSVKNVCLYKRLQDSIGFLVFETQVRTRGGSKLHFGFEETLSGTIHLIFTLLTSVCDITADSSCCVYVSWSLVIRHLEHLQRRLNEQSHPELRHKIQCERCFSTGSSETRTTTANNLARSESLLALSLKSRTLFRKVLTDKVNLNVVDPDPAAAEKHRLWIIIIIIIVIIIILWYNKDIRLPVQAQWGVQWFCCCYGTMKPAGIGCRLDSSVSQPTVCQESAGWEGLDEGGSVKSHGLPMGDQCNSDLQRGSTVTIRLPLIINGCCTCKGHSWNYLWISHWYILDFFWFLSGNQWEVDCFPAGEHGDLLLKLPLIRNGSCTILNLFTKGHLWNFH